MIYYHENIIEKEWLSQHSSISQLQTHVEQVRPISQFAQNHPWSPSQKRRYESWKSFKTNHYIIMGLFHSWWLTTEKDLDSIDLYNSYWFLHKNLHFLPSLYIFLRFDLISRPWTRLDCIFFCNGLNWQFRRFYAIKLDYIILTDISEHAKQDQRTSQERFYRSVESWKYCG